MATILQRTISSVLVKRLVLSNSQAARPMPFGTDWTKVRVGCLWHIRDTGADITGTPRLAVGICSGITNLLGDATTTHFTGVRLNDATIVRSAEDYLIDGLTWLPIKRVGTTVSSGTGFFSGIQWGIGNGAAANRADRTAFFVDITKGSPNFTFQLFGWINATPVNDVAQALYRQQLESAGVPVIAQHQQSVTQTLAVSEADGALNTAAVMWDRTTPEVEIEEFDVVRLA